MNGPHLRYKRPSFAGKVLLLFLLPTALMAGLPDSAGPASPQTCRGAMGVLACTDKTPTDGAPGTVDACFPVMLGE